MASEGKSSAVARVTLTIEVDCSSRWGGDCSLGQLSKQGKEEAIGKLRTLLETTRGVRIVGEPSVRAIITEEQG